MSIYLIALLPVLGWGFMPIIANLRKSTPEEQLLGTSISALLFAFILFWILSPEITVLSFIVSFISGIFWSFGQLLQFKGIAASNVAKAMPISNGTQLVGATLFAVLVFQEWQTVTAVIIGVIAVILILIGVVMTGFQKRGNHITESVSFHVYGIVILSSFFLTLYVVTNQLFDVTGFSIILPQAIGMLTCAIGINLAKKTAISRKNVTFNLMTGLSWSIANLGMFLATAVLGVATSFSISQACVIVATIGGILIFKQKKSPLEWTFILSGILLIMVGVVFLSLLK
ncbi:GRP family sugar transporter [Listeria innocua]|uniref:GRP family sugar transporter n=1 Tax=Listeria innocua TaxID=1642 RepID=UPI0013666ADD|nr:GRP family sugar transporter [Listeria innocua]MWW18630.1 sugar uptake protein [Listeria monocytogenes]EAF5667087.1 sugar uptake protein [Listeria innocua]EAG9435419.1 sugar uptake protein [Listeria innocua]EIX3330397.1 GRP family sugar transporter [Listeria innocua]EIX6955752.1 GRP family sugar transporter [Listeria innocua]